MSAFLSIRNYVYFRHLFDAVHPLFWPVLYWQLKRAWLCLRRENLNSILLAVTWWGGVRIVHRGDRIVEAEPNPFALTKPRYDDPVWSTDVPAAFLDGPSSFLASGGFPGSEIAPRFPRNGIKDSFPPTPPRFVIPAFVGMTRDRREIQNRPASVASGRPRLPQRGCTITGTSS
jgi:hypothetical protein